MDIPRKSTNQPPKIVIQIISLYTYYTDIIVITYIIQYDDIMKPLHLARFTSRFVSFKGVPTIFFF